jgi:hypothetical protein
MGAQAHLQQIGMDQSSMLHAVKSQNPKVDIQYANYRGGECGRKETRGTIIVRVTYRHWEDGEVR